MKQYRNPFVVLAMAFLTVMMLYACSKEELDDIADVPAADGTYNYTLHLNCQIEDSTSASTRAVSSWDNGATIYLRFRNGSSYVSGTAVYNSNTKVWSFSSNSSLPTITSSTTCEAYYFKNPGTVYTSSVNLTEYTACYQGTGNYSHPNSADVYVSVTLKPKNWRLRFYGRTSGTMTILGNSSDISYYTSFNRSTGEFSSTKKDVSLSITNGSYSSYIYGFFASPSSSNKITVRTNSDSKEFYRTINGTSLQSNGSGWLYAPYISNYTGWTCTNDDTFTISMSTTNYKADGDYWNLSVSANSSLSWTASASQSWVHFSASKNSTYTSTGSGSVSVYVDANPNLTSRTAYVYVRAGSTTKTITITQEAGSFSASMSTTNYKAAGDYWYLGVTASSGITWTASASQSWVHFTASKNSTYTSTGTGSVAVYVDANPYSYSRTAYVYVKTGSTTKTITITQSANANSAPYTINSVQVANINYNGNIINDFGTTIYSSRTQYLALKIYATVNIAGYYGLTADLYSPGNVYEVTFTWDEKYRSLGSIVFSSSGWGRSTYGTWGAGQYKIVVGCNNKTLYTYYFYIY